MATTHYIFVDFENVQSVNLDLVEGKPVKVILLAGKGQTRVDWTLAESIHRHSAQVQLVKAETSGPNALDFVLAWEVGAQAAADPQGSYHVVSKDRGFDAMIAHLKSRGMQAARHGTFAGVPPLGGAKATAHAPAKPAAKPAQKQKAKTPRPPAKPAKPATPVARAEEVRLWMEKYPANRPKRKTALTKLIQSNIVIGITTPDLEAVLDQLVALKIIAISDAGAVSYPQ